MILSLVFLSLLNILADVDHDFNLATFTMQQQDDQWTLIAEYTPEAIFAAIKEEHDKDWSQISQKAYKKLIKDYLLKTIQIRFDDTPPLTIKCKKVLIGSHASRAEFTLDSFPEDWKRMHCSIQSFQTNKYQSNLIRIKGIGNDQFKAFLRASNDFQTTFINKY